MTCIALYTRLYSVARERALYVFVALKAAENKGFYINKYKNIYLYSVYSVFFQLSTFSISREKTPFPPPAKNIFICRKSAIRAIRFFPEHIKQNKYSILGCIVQSHSRSYISCKRDCIGLYA